MEGINVCCDRRKDWNWGGGGVGVCVCVVGKERGAGADRWKKGNEREVVNGFWALIEKEGGRVSPAIEIAKTTTTTTSLDFFPCGLFAFPFF